MATRSVSALRRRRKLERALVLSKVDRNRKPPGAADPNIYAIRAHARGQQRVPQVFDSPALTRVDPRARVDPRNP
jgi:hypothetical protein